MQLHRRELSVRGWGYEDSEEFIRDSDLKLRRAYCDQVLLDETFAFVACKSAVDAGRRIKYIVWRGRMWIPCRSICVCCMNRRRTRGIWTTTVIRNFGMTKRSMRGIRGT